MSGIQQEESACVIESLQSSSYMVWRGSKLEHLFVILDEVVGPRICQLHCACIVLVALDPVRELQGVGARRVYELLRLPHHNAKCRLLLLLKLLGVQYTGLRVCLRLCCQILIIGEERVMRFKCVLEPLSRQI